MFCLPLLMQFYESSLLCYRMETIATAGKQQLLLEAEAEAEAVRLRGEAEALAIEVCGRESIVDKHYCSSLHFCKNQNTHSKLI